jgi:hypothetical protein
MKQLKTILIGIAIGLAIGMALGFNMGRDKPLLSNPFEHETLGERIKRLSGETLEQGGKALEKTGESLQDKLKKQ